MGEGVTWADLLPSDVLLNNEGFPIIVVLRCNRSENVFAWMHLTGINAAREVDADLACVDMWGDNLTKSYTAILRGAEMIKT